MRSEPPASFGFRAILLHLLGIDDTKLTYRPNGIDRRLTDVHGHVVKELLAWRCGGGRGRRSVNLLNGETRSAQSEDDQSNSAGTPPDRSRRRAPPRPLILAFLSNSLDT